jgi:mRNA interferase MazF
VVTCTVSAHLETLGGMSDTDLVLTVVVQSDDLLLSTLPVAPTSTSAPGRSFRPTITINVEATRVRVEQTSAVVLERTGEFVGRVSSEELSDINDALRLALELD